MIAMRTGGLASELIVTENFFGELRERVGKLKAQIPWLRVFVEGVVIVSMNQSLPLLPLITFSEGPGFW